MKVLVDATCAEFGGIRTYVEQLLSAWALQEPGDDVHVVVPRGSTLPTPGWTRHEITVPRPAQLGRPLAQTRHLRRLARELDVDAALLTLPSTTVRRLPVPSVVTVHDLRHVLRPAQFSRRQRILRAVSYGRGYAIADGFAVISQRTLDDLHRSHPATRGVPARVAYLGADHVADWARSEGQAGTGPALAFGHHSNKNLDLVLDTWRLLAGDPLVDEPELLIVGVGGARREGVEAEIAARGLTGRVRTSPFLDDPKFQRTMAAARAIVFPSDFEGFGLPVAEGMTLGIPVVIGPEEATTEVAGGHAHRAAAWSAEAVAEATRSALAMDGAAIEAARERGSQFTWARTLVATREALRDASEARGRPLPLVG